MPYTVSGAAKPASGQGPPNDTPLFLCCDFITQRDGKCTIDKDAWPKILPNSNVPTVEDPEGTVNVDCSPVGR